MPTPLLPGLESVACPVLGMLHLPALPGAPRFGGDLAAVTDFVLRDAETLLAGGVHGLVLENFNDTPFFPDRVPPYVVAHMTRVAGRVAERFDVPLGINVLRNDPHAALGIAHAVGAAFIRVNILSGARVTDQGVIAGTAHTLLRERALLHAEHIRIFADVNVKHSQPLGRPRALEDEVGETLERAGADAVVVTGRGTGLPTDVEDAQRCRAAAGPRPVVIGCGLTAENIGDFRPYADAFIVGTAFKAAGNVHEPVERSRVEAVLAALK